LPKKLSNNQYWNMTENEIIIANLKAEIIKLKVEYTIEVDYKAYQPRLVRQIALLEKEIEKLTPIKVS
jgi:uncharacterized small protein (DUF1192 family)